MGVLDGSRGITAVYLELSQISHSCSPNTYHTCWSDRRLLVKAARPIAEGEPITFCKVDNAKCNIFRRRLLEDALVDCQCPRLQKRSKKQALKKTGVLTEQNW